MGRQWVYGQWREKLRGHSRPHTLREDVQTVMSTVVRVNSSVLLHRVHFTHRAMATQHAPTQTLGTHLLLHHDPSRDLVLALASHRLNTTRGAIRRAATSLTEALVNSQLSLPVIAHASLATSPPSLVVARTMLDLQPCCHSLSSTHSTQTPHEKHLVHRHRTNVTHP